LFYEAASAAIRLIRDALGGSESALKKLSPIFPKRLRTSMARAAAEERARKKLRRR
jgi:hypothetical protein